MTLPVTLNQDCYHNICAGQKIQRFSKFIKLKKSRFYSDMIFNIYIFKQFLSPIRISGCNPCGPEASLDTKIGHIDLYLILKLYVLFDIKCHLISHEAYDIIIWHKLIWLIMVSKEASVPQELHPLLRFG